MDGILCANTACTQTNQIQIAKDRMRAETVGQAGEKQTVVFDGVKQVLWLINTGRKSYSEMTKADVDRLGGQMSDAMARLQEQLKSLPPEQRAQIEALMAGRGGLGGPPGGRGGAAAPPQVNFAKAGGSKTVAGWSCDQYRKTVNGQQEEDLCLARITAVGLSAADFQVFERFSTFMAPLMTSPMMPKNDIIMGWNDMNKAVGFPAAPLETVTYAGGKPDRQMTVNKMERTAIPAGTYELPAGLTKQEIPGLGGPGGRGPR